MGPMKLYFDFRDIFRAPRLGLSGKKIMVFTVANLIGWAVYWVLTYLAFSVSGYSFNAIWDAYGLYPCLFGHTAAWYGWTIYYIGLLFWFFSLNFACTSVARITYKQLKGDEFFSSGDAWKYSKKHWYPIVFTSISLMAIVVFFLIGAVIFALIGKIPYIGEFLFSLPYLLYFFGAVFTVYTIVVFVISILYAPAIVGAYEEDTMGAVFQSYSITWSQPWRILVYHSLLLPILGIGVAVLRFFWIGGYYLINTVFGQSWLMGSKLTHVVGRATDIVLPFRNICCNTGCCNGHMMHHHIHNAGASCLMHLPNGTVLSGTESVSAVILAIFLFVLLFTVFSYALSTLSVGETLMFVIFKKKSDDDNLLERKDEDELEEEEENEDMDEFKNDDDETEAESSEETDSESDSDSASNDSEEETSKD